MRRDDGGKSERKLVGLKREDREVAIWWAWLSFRGLFLMLTDCWAYSGTRLLVSSARF